MHKFTVRPSHALKDGVRVPAWEVLTQGGQHSRTSLCDGELEDGGARAAVMSAIAELGLDPKACAVKFELAARLGGSESHGLTG